MHCNLNGIQWARPYLEVVWRLDLSQKVRRKDLLKGHVTLLFLALSSKPGKKSDRWPLPLQRTLSSPPALPAKFAYWDLITLWAEWRQWGWLLIPGVNAKAYCVIRCQYPDNVSDCMWRVNALLLVVKTSFLLSLISLPRWAMLFIYLIYFFFICWKNFEIMK